MNKELQHDVLTEFKTSMDIGMQKIYEACKIYVSTIDAHPDMKKVFLNKFQNEIPVTCWKMFERVGRGNMHYKLLHYGGKNYGVVRKLCMSDQTRVVDGVPVELLTSANDVLLVDPREVSAFQAKQLFAGGVIRPVEQQRAYIEGLKTKTMVQETLSEVVPVYTISDRKISIQGGIYPKSVIKQMVKDLFSERELKQLGK